MAEALDLKSGNVVTPTVASGAAAEGLRGNPVAKPRTAIVPLPCTLQTAVLTPTVTMA